MKILIVDDLKSRVDKITQIINKSFPWAKIEDTDKAGSARQFLRSSKYDLVIVDIHLPLRAGDSPDAKNGIELIDFITRNDSVHRPYMVLGITSKGDSLEDIRISCSDSSVFIASYDEASDSWLEIIDFAIKNIVREQANHKDLIILTTTGAEESAVINSDQFSWLPVRRSLKNLTNYTEGTLSFDGATYKAACVRLTRMGMIDSAIVTTALISELHPKIMIMTGICGGVPGKVKLGDVIVGTSSWDWQRGKYNGNAKSYTHVSEPDPAVLSDSLQRKIRDWIMEIEKDRKFSLIKTSPELKDEITIRSGPILSGSAVISSGKKINEITLQSRAAMAIDMEIFGFYSVARALESESTTLIAVKSVCDLADENKNDKYHAYCSNLSTFVGIELGKKLLTEIVSE